MTFRMRKKPTKPERITTVIEIHLYDCVGQTLQSVIDECHDKQIEPSQLTFITEESYGCHECSFQGSRPLTDKEYELRLKEYEADLAKWNLWADKNAEKIKEHEEKQLQKEKVAKQKAKEDKIKRLATAKARLEKKLKKLLEENK